MRILTPLLLAGAALLLPAALAAEETPNPAATTPEATRGIGPGARPVGAPWSRSPVVAPHGMAATAHPLATQIALDILKAGGSAVDAAIAANAALGLMEPTGNGIGGDLFAIVYDPKTGQLIGINGSGRSPAGQTLDQLKAKLPAGATSIPPVGPLPVTIPGTVDAWFDLHARFGKLPMADVLAPTIRYAREGHPVAPVIAMYMERGLKNYERQLKKNPFEFDNARKVYFKDGRAPRAGEMFRNPDLASTLEAIATGGRDAFYKGQLAKVMADYLQRQGSAFTLADFERHDSAWVDVACVHYRKGYELCELPPNSQGFAALQMVNILKNIDLAQWERGSPEVIHYITEAKRLAFEDAARFYADPAFAKVPAELLTDEYGKQRFALIDPAKATDKFSPGALVAPKLEGEGDTTYLTVADNSGMMVSLIQSNYRGMGGGLVPDGLGFMFQDRGELYSLDPAHPNAYAPAKRPFQTIIPAFIKKDGKPWMSFGLMGGGMQPQGHVQVLINLVDYGMNLQEAGDAARLHHDGGRQPTDALAGSETDTVALDTLGVLQVEPGISGATVAALREMGHNVEVETTGIPFGGYQAIARDPVTGVYTGATEMRKDGQASGY
ncbi:gamma-glutamyltransferase family protein [Erythrobacter sp. BLCC-B19]|uniref:gamma-glutamyltransferase family protein n=1 Tax=Erythrobacter sp. BLCC-B19 TaxID=3025315 RepID=UPI00235DE250|nr:gamma-glutamyltransferase family protein [Erythrobacter sp. BLCC-B19]WDA42715.1 gamma-glutamyltransferase family protein [Erythrobacter sp. BLCC-B19]